MKRIARIMVLAVLLGVLLPSYAPGATSGISGLTKWMEDNAALRNCVNNGAWSTKPGDAPSDKEVAAMLRMALMPGTAHMLTPAHFVVIRDYQEQKKILGAMPGMVSEGTVTVLVLADTLRDQAHHAEPYNSWYHQMYYGIFDAGVAAGYLNLAAISMGYGTHFYAMINLPVDGKVDLTNGGKFSLIRGNNWDISRYASSKDGTRQFIHTVGAYTGPIMGPPPGAGAPLPAGRSGSGPGSQGFGPTKKDIPAEGNLTLLATIVIGKPAQERIDAMTAATMSARPDNFNFWDPQDSSSYGNAKKIGEKSGVAK
jgi:hypothetical protein